jgi:hypothetical protein
MAPHSLSTGRRHPRPPGPATCHHGVRDHGVHEGGPLTKRIALAADGTVNSDGSACLMVRGSAERVRLHDIVALAALIEKLGSDQAIALGRLRPGLPDHVEIITKRRLNGVAQPHVIARTKLANNLDNAVRDGHRTLILRRRKPMHGGPKAAWVYFVHVIYDETK